jgi:hypothetical protein
VEVEINQFFGVMQRMFISVNTMQETMKPIAEIEEDLAKKQNRFWDSSLLPNSREAQLEL